MDMLERYPEINIHESQISSEAFERGKAFVDGLRSLHIGLTGLKVIEHERWKFTFTPRSGQFMAVIPNEPIDRAVIGFNQHKGDEKITSDKTMGPIVIVSISMLGLTDNSGQETDLQIAGTSPEWKLTSKHTPNYIYELYTFDPTKHRIAIVDTKPENE